MQQGKSTKRERQRSSSRRSSASTSRLERMIAEATVDCYNNGERAMGLFNMITENVILPFATTVLGLPVAVERIDLNDAGEIVAVCCQGSGKAENPNSRPSPSFPSTRGNRVDRSLSPLGEGEIATRRSHSGNAHIGNLYIAVSGRSWRRRSSVPNSFAISKHSHLNKLRRYL